METREVSNKLISFIMKIKKYARGCMNVNKLEPCNLTEQQFRTLMNIKIQRKGALKDLSKSMNVSTPSLCIMLNKMTEEGYVSREIDNKDRRNTFYSLTDEGERFLENEIEARLTLIDGHISKLSEEKKEKLYRCLVDLDEIIDELR